MKSYAAGNLRLPIFAMGVLAFAGAVITNPLLWKLASHPRRGPLRSAPRPQPLIFTTRRASRPEQTPILSEVERREILTLMAPKRPIRSGSSGSPPFHGRRVGVVAYIVPDEATSRMRVGKRILRRPRLVETSAHGILQMLPTR